MYYMSVAALRDWLSMHLKHQGKVRATNIRQNLGFSTCRFSQTYAKNMALFLTS